MTVVKIKKSVKPSRPPLPPTGGCGGRDDNEGDDEETEDNNNDNNNDDEKAVIDEWVRVFSSVTGFSTNKPPRDEARLVIKNFGGREGAFRAIRVLLTARALSWVSSPTFKWLTNPKNTTFIAGATRSAKAEFSGTRTEKPTFEVKKRGQSR